MRFISCLGSALKGLPLGHYPTVYIFKTGWIVTRLSIFLMLWFFFTILWSFALFILSNSIFFCCHTCFFFFFLSISQFFKSNLKHALCLTICPCLSDYLPKLSLSSSSRLETSLICHIIKYSFSWFSFLFSLSALILASASVSGIYVKTFKNSGVVFYLDSFFLFLLASSRASILHCTLPFVLFLFYIPSAIIFNWHTLTPFPFYPFSNPTNLSRYPRY